MLRASSPQNDSMFCFRFLDFCGQSEKCQSEMTKFESQRRVVETVVLMNKEDVKGESAKFRQTSAIFHEPAAKSQIFVFFQSGASLCVFVLLACLALTVFVLLLTRSGANERFPCSGSGAEIV